MAETSKPRRIREPRLPWTAEDEETIMREDLTPEQAAELTGRTLIAVIEPRQLITYTRRPIPPLH